MKLSKRQTLLLRLIAQGGDRGWTPGDRWAPVPIQDGLLPDSINGGGSDAQALLALERKGLIIRPTQHVIKYHCCITDAGSEIIQKLLTDRSPKGTRKKS